MSVPLVQPCLEVDCPGWLELRRWLWPGDDEAQHRAEMASFLAEPDRYAQFVAYDPEATPLGFIEIALRRDYVNGTASSPVVFLEGIFVVPEMRRQGVATALVKTAENWAREHGCREFASDASIENLVSHSLHRALGFEETERVVFFRKPL